MADMTLKLKIDPNLVGFGLYVDSMSYNCHFSDFLSSKMADKMIWSPMVPSTYNAVLSFSEFFWVPLKSISTLICNIHAFDLSDLSCKSGKENPQKSETFVRNRKTTA